MAPIGLKAVVGESKSQCIYFLRHSVHICICIYLFACLFLKQGAFPSCAFQWPLSWMLLNSGLYWISDIYEYLLVLIYKHRQSFFYTQERKKPKLTTSFLWCRLQRNWETPVFLDRRERTKDAAFPYCSVTPYKAAESHSLKTLSLQFHSADPKTDLFVMLMQGSGEL